MLDEVALLEQGLGLDLKVLGRDLVVVEAALAQPGQGLARLVVAAHLHQPARGEGHPPDADGEQRGGDALDDGGQAPGQVGLHAAGTDEVAAVADPEAEHDAQDGGELVEADDETAGLGRRDLGVVQRAHAAEGADAQAGEEAAGVQQGRVARRGADVEVAAQQGPAAAREHGVLAREDLAHEAGRQRADDTAQLQDRGEPARGRRRGHHGREVLGEAAHDERLREDALLVAILEPAEAMHELVHEQGSLAAPLIRPTYDARSAMSISFGFDVMDDHLVFTAASTRCCADRGTLWDFSTLTEVSASATCCGADIVFSAMLGFLSSDLSKNQEMGRGRGQCSNDVAHDEKGGDRAFLFRRGGRRFPAFSSTTRTIEKNHALLTYSVHGPARQVVRGVTMWCSNSPRALSLHESDHL